MLEKLGVKVWAFVTKLIHLMFAFKQGKLFKHRTCLAALSLFRNRLLSRSTKIRLYKTLIRPIVTYGAETW
jgi:hypothetical protein